MKKVNKKKIVVQEQPIKNSYYRSFMENIAQLNTSKFFTGVIIITLNIGSKYITLELSKTQEEYVKYTLGRQILVFSILWMGTRDIVTALILTCVFIIFADYLLNDNSRYCIIPSTYISKVHDTNNNKISKKDINDAINILKKARKQKQKNIDKSEDKDLYIHKGLYKENFM